VWSISGKGTHLTLSLSFQERGPAFHRVTERISRKP
jgi:hypothetical protein